VSRILHIKTPRPPRNRTIGLVISTSLVILPPSLISFFFLHDTPSTELYTLSLHDALPISGESGSILCRRKHALQPFASAILHPEIGRAHVELQSLRHLVCRLLLEKKKQLKEVQKLMPNICTVELFVIPIVPLRSCL